MEFQVMTPPNPALEQGRAFEEGETKQSKSKTARQEKKKMEEKKKVTNTKTSADVFNNERCYFSKINVEKRC